MKKISLLFSIIFAFVSCNNQKKAMESNSNNSIEKSISQESIKLEYSTMTRGFNQNISIENQKISIKGRKFAEDYSSEEKLSDADWNEILVLAEKINLDDLQTYKDPTQARFYDGDAIANLTIFKNGKEYKTTDFDHGKPPVEIEKLVNKLVSFVKKK